MRPLHHQPLTLLLPGMPGADNPQAEVETTGVTDRVSLVDLWNWLKATTWRPPWISVEQSVYEGNALPAWDWHRVRWGEDEDTHGDD